MSLMLLALYVLPPIGYAAFYIAHCFKRKKIKAAIGVFALSLLVILLGVWLAIES